MIRFYNTYTKREEEFSPIISGEVRMYTCGPTVYGYAHIGNFRTFLFEDLLRRFLKFSGYRVTQVMNITDVDDKTIRDSKAAGMSLREFTDRYTEAFLEDLDTLGMERAEYYPRATDHIPEMVGIIQKLLAAGHAYQKDGSIYFRIKTFASYGKLSGIDPEELQDGISSESDEYEKESPKDFALWKAAKEGEPFWDTELGKGRPGWHIECSAMSMKYLGETFDIHTGGVDNIFPHHENEIAQSEATTGHPFVRYWLHSQHLIVEGEKMAKSKGNFFTVRDLISQGTDPMALRYLLLSTHYRQMLNFTRSGLDGAASALRRLADFLHVLRNTTYVDKSDGTMAAVIRDAKTRFLAGLESDLNTSMALSAAYDLVRHANIVMSGAGVTRDEAAAISDFLGDFNKVFAVLTPPKAIEDEDVLRLIEDRRQARGRREWKRSDEIRELLLRKGIVLEDAPAGTRFKRM